MTGKSLIACVGLVLLPALHPCQVRAGYRMGPTEPDRTQVANGGFDHSIKGWSGAARMALSWNAEHGHQAKGCLEATSTEDGGHHIISFNGSFLMHADRHYRCVFWAKAPSCRKPFLFSVFEPEEGAMFENPPLGDEWQRYSFPIFVPVPGAPALTIFYKNLRLIPDAVRKGETVYIDDVVIFDVEYGPMAPVSAGVMRERNMISENGAFDADLKGWNDAGTRMKYTFVSDDGHDADGCLKAQATQTDGWNYIAYKGNVGAVQKGRQYRIGWYAKSPNSTAAFVLHHAMLYGLTAESKVAAISNPALSPAWQRYEIRYIPDRSSQMPSLTLILPPVAGAEVYVDDVYFVTVNKTD